MFAKMSVCVMFLLLLSGVTSVSEQLKDQLKQLPQHYSQFDVKMGWAATTEKGAVVISGVLQNVRYATMENIEIRVSALDANGTSIGRGVEFVLPRVLSRDDVAPFRIQLPSSAARAAKLQFTYTYFGFDGGGSGGDGTSWMQSFESVMPAGT
jgi:hypothetical protein